jgi:IS605 OrfB family transposase
MFECEDKPKITGNTSGIDIGIESLATMNDGQFTPKDKDGWDLTKIINRINQRVKGSKGYARCQAHRANFINWSINQLNFDKVKTLRLEDLYNVRRNKRTSKFLNRWTYTEIKGKFESKCEALGVQVVYVCPTYTSQRCSSCGWVRKSNRKGKEFKCGRCYFALDADLNAAKNIALNLRPIGTKERLSHKNRKGFYLCEVVQEPIVPVAQKT